MIGVNSPLSIANSVPNRFIVTVHTQNLCFKATGWKLGFQLKRWKELQFYLRFADWIMLNWLGKMGIGCFGDRPKLGQKKEVESVTGGEDFIDKAMSNANITPEHLVVMVNGLIGCASDWKFAADQLVKKFPDKVVVHCSESNSSTLTFDGVDLMGERLANEVLTVVKSRPGLRKISFIAHSLGGLVARYAIGRLYQPPEQLVPVTVQCNSLSEEKSGTESQSQSFEEPCESKIAGLEPMNFITVATPHLGSRGNRQFPILCGLAFLERQASQTAHLVAGRSGKHLFLTDSDDGRPPLLLRMVTDSYDLKFISALRCFRRRVAYANANYDHMVGWRTSSIRRKHELPKVKLLRKNDKYPHIVYIQRDNPEENQVPSRDENRNIVFIQHDNLQENEMSSKVKDWSTDFEEEMIRGLNQVSWERVDVSFHKSTQRYVAHTTIQVKSYWFNSDGVDVIFHMIDNLLL